MIKSARGNWIDTHLERRTTPKANGASCDGEVHESQPARVAAAHEAFLCSKESGVACALQVALRTLLQQPGLPDNPFFFLATVLMAFHDRSATWSEPAEDLVYRLDAYVPLMKDNYRCICTLSEFPQALGLPHVLRFANPSGLKAIHHVLVHNLHHSFFNSPVPTRSTSKNLVARVLCSLQGNAIVYDPATQLFPTIKVRADVLISGRAVEDAIDMFGAIIMRESREIQQLPLNTLVAVRAVKPVSQDQDGPLDYRQTAATLFMTGQQIEADSASFLQMARKAVLSSMVHTATLCNQCMHGICTDT
jgi:hypothetical protein